MRSALQEVPMIPERFLFIKYREEILTILPNTGAIEGMCFKHTESLPVPHIDQPKTSVCLERGVIFKRVTKDLWKRLHCRVIVTSDVSLS